jgi:hypothetical protein
MSAQSAPGSSAIIGTVRRQWLRVLVSVLGAYEIGLAFTARPAIAALGVIGGLLVVAAPWVARRSTAWAVALLIVGTLPFAVLTWWSLIVPLVAVLALAIGLPVILRGDAEVAESMTTSRA